MLDVLETRVSIATGTAKTYKNLHSTTHSTFEDYCQERFGIGRNYVNRRVVFAGILENLVPRGTIPPATEGQARPLAKLETPEQQAQAAEVQLSLPNYTNCIKTPESHLRPLAPLTDEERRAGGSPNW